MFSLVAVVIVTATWSNARAQGPVGLDPDLFRELERRNIGPHRASRTKALDDGQTFERVLYTMDTLAWSYFKAGRLADAN